MNKKSLVAVCVFVVAASLAAVASVWYLNFQDGKNVRGQYAFAETRHNMENLQTIKICSAQEKCFTVYRQGELWFLKEASDYFVNVQMLVQFFNMVNQSIIMTVQDENNTFSDSEENFGVRVQTFDEHGLVMDDVVLGKPAEKEGYYFAKRFDKPFIYTISSVNGFSGEISAWLPYPLMKLPHNSMASMVIDGKLVNRQLMDMILPQSKMLQAVLGTLAYVDYSGITTRDNFFAQYPEAVPHTIKIEMDDGVIYILDIYHEDALFWLSVQVEHIRIAPKDAVAFVEQNKKYYANWLFLMNDRQAEILYNLDLNN